MKNLLYIVLSLLFLGCYTTTYIPNDEVVEVQTRIIYDYWYYSTWYWSSPYYYYYAPYHYDYYYWHWYYPRYYAPRYFTPRYVARPDVVRRSGPTRIQTSAQWQRYQEQKRTRTEPPRNSVTVPQRSQQRQQIHKDTRTTGPDRIRRDKEAPNSKPSRRTR